MNRLSQINLSLAVMILFTVSGCQTAKFQGIPSTSEDETLLEQIRRNPNRHKGKVVLLGGEIRDLRYVTWQTEVEFSEIPLQNGIYPKLGVAGGDRFYVVFPERVDKFLYKKEKVITVAGRVIGTRAIDGKEYPLFAFEKSQVWDRLRQDRFPSFGALMGQF